jgi:hypothetical protein
MTEGQPVGGEQLNTLEDTGSDRSRHMKFALFGAAGVMILCLATCGGAAYYTKFLLGPQTSDILERGTPVRMANTDGSFGRVTDYDLEKQGGAVFPAGEILVVPPDDEVFVHCGDDGRTYHVGTKDEDGASSGKETDVSGICYQERVRDRYWRRVVLEWLREYLPFIFPKVPQTVPPEF